MIMVDTAYSILCTQVSRYMEGKLEANDMEYNYLWVFAFVVVTHFYRIAC